MEVLKLENVKKYYGVNTNITKAVDGISFNVDEGEFVAIMGASGSGKTTLLNCISTIDNVTAGHIYVGGKDITEIKEDDMADFRKENLGFSNRSSFFKEKILKGIILTIVFAKVHGDINEIKQKSIIAHMDRMRNQPGPTNNLGSIFKRDELTAKGQWICRICRFTAKILHKSEHDHSILKFKLLLAGYPHLGKYLFDMNRFMWVDINSHNAFNDYLRLRKAMYKNNKFEIEIFS